MRSAAHPRRAILVATDFSKPAKVVIPYALKLASVLNLRLIVLHVVKAPPGFEQWSPGARRSLNSLKTKALLELGKIIRMANENGLMADHKLLAGIPEDSILQAAHSPDVVLVAMGTHGKSGLDRLRLGSVAETILCKAPCPILTVRASTAHIPVNMHRFNLSRLLVATDFSRSSNTALRSAIVLAKRLRAHVVLIHAAKPSGLLRSAPLPVCVFPRKRLTQQLQKIILSARADEVITDEVMITGNPIDVILKQAKREKADLIIVGTHGRRGIRRLILGSVAEAVIRKAACPVLVVKAEQKSRLSF